MAPVFPRNITYNVETVTVKGIQYMPCGNESVLAATTGAPHQSPFDAFLYIVVVLMFYSLSIVFLMIKYVRREQEEATLDYYYDEFVKREKFSGNYIPDKRTCLRTQAIERATQNIKLNSSVKKTEVENSEESADDMEGKELLYNTGKECKVKINDKEKNTEKTNVQIHIPIETCV